MHTQTFIASALLLAALGCRDDSESLTEPQVPPQVNLTAATGLSFWQVSAGLFHTCGITTDNRAYCWGGNELGELGDGSNFRHLAPVAVLGGLRFRQIAAGSNLTCGVTTDYRVYCWGSNAGGALGIGTTEGPEICLRGDPCSMRPVAVAPARRFRQVDVGGHACGVTYVDRLAYCWGSNRYGKLGDGTFTPRSLPVAVVGRRRFRQVSVGAFHTCAVTTSDRAYCWGWNGYGQLGDSSSSIQRPRPVRVSGGRAFRQVDAGRLHTCGVTGAARAYCWGDGTDGKLGNGKTYLSSWPRAVAGGLLFGRVTAGDDHTCGETTTNRAYCWGLNDPGRLGDGTTDSRLRPVAVAGGFYFAQVSAGGFHTCGKTIADVAYCWGNNRGALGDGTNTDRLTPTAVAGPM